MWKILTATSTALFLLGTPALADWDEWNANNDEFLDETEFSAGFGEGGVYADWDIDRDNQLTQDEYNAGVFGQHDANEDRMWDENEFRAFNERNFGAYGDLDRDESGFLSEDEFGGGVYGAYDADEDRQWNQEEYGAYEQDGWF